MIAHIHHCHHSDPNTLLSMYLVATVLFLYPGVRLAVNKFDWLRVEFSVAATGTIFWIVQGIALFAILTKITLSWI